MCGSKKSSPAPQIIYVPEPVYVPKAAEPAPAAAPAPAATTDPSASRDRRRSARRPVGALLSGGPAALTSSPSATPGRAGLG